LTLLAAAVLALLVANSPLRVAYEHLLAMPLSLGKTPAVLSKPLLLWINDGLMAIFFLLVGLEIKRELLRGALSSRKTALLPLIAALGGMVVPAMIYSAINWDNDVALRGWAIPAATDIAFAVSVLAVLGSRVPQSLKVFLLALAIIDDLGAILIIAIFYASDLSAMALGLAGLITAALVALNLFGVTRLAPYLLLGALLWASMLFSGVHATLAGVVLAMTIPLGAPAAGQGHASGSALYRLEDALGPWVAFVVVPLFGFANAGVSLAGVNLEMMLAPLSLGIVLGLFIGKQLGIMTSIVAAHRAGIIQLPAEATWREVYGVAILCGIGFTMSLFIGLLAFDDPERESMVKLAVLTGSLLSTLAGAAVLLLRRPATGAQASIPR
jgi:NhaA family Na+:H+ antiporter